jgi:hypothetical protein
MQAWLVWQDEGGRRLGRSSELANAHFVRVVQHNSAVIVGSARQDTDKEEDEQLAHAVRFPLFFCTAPALRCSQELLREESCKLPLQVAELDSLMRLHALRPAPLRSSHDASKALQAITVLSQSSIQSSA